MRELFSSGIPFFARKESQPQQPPPYFEVDRIISNEQLQAFLQENVPTGFTVVDLGEEYDLSNGGDLVFRYITLPNNPLLRTIRVNEIRRKGTDKKERIFYQDGELPSGQRRLKDNEHLWCSLSLSKWRDPLKRWGNPAGINGLLVYDAINENGLIREFDDFDILYSYKNPKEKQKALLAIVGFVK